MVIHCRKSFSTPKDTIRSLFEQGVQLRCLVTASQRLAVCHRSVIRTSSVAEADDPCFGAAQMATATIIGRNTATTKPAVTSG